MWLLYILPLSLAERLNLPNKLYTLISTQRLYFYLTYSNVSIGLREKLYLYISAYIYDLIPVFLLIIYFTILFYFILISTING